MTLQLEKAQQNKLESFPTELETNFLVDKGVGDEKDDNTYGCKNH